MVLSVQIIIGMMAASLAASLAILWMSANSQVLTMTTTQTVKPTTTR